MEKKDELVVAINKEYHKSMYNFHKRINRKEKIIGWFTTASSEGSLINDNSSLIHDFYSAECTDPIHLVVDTTLAGNIMGVRGFLSESLLIGDMNLANMFHELRVDFVVTDSEATCLYQMIHAQESTKLWKNSEIVSTLPSQRDTVNSAMSKLLDILDEIQVYVDKVVDGPIGEVTAISEIGMKIADAIGALQSVRPEDFHTVLQEKIQDLLMLSYTASLTQTQLQLSEKIIKVL